MSNFDQNLPKNLLKLRYKRKDIIEKIELGQHRCDCEFCEVEREDGLSDEAIKELEKDLEALEAEISSLEKYAEQHDIKTDVLP